MEDTTKQDKPQEKPVTFEEAMQAMFPNLVSIQSVHQGPNREQRRAAKRQKER